MTFSDVRLSLEFERALEDLVDDAVRLKGKLKRISVDELYLRRGLQPNEVVAIEKALKTAGIEIIEGVEKLTPTVDTSDDRIISSSLGYLMSVSKKYPLLNYKEEVECGEAIQAAFRLSGAEETQLVDRVRERAKNAKTKLVVHNIRLVAKVAFEKRFRGMLEADDLVQMGLIGLMRAADIFDPEWGTRFSTYAVWWIRQAITRGIADHSTLIRIPVHMREHISKYKRTRNRLGYGDGYNGNQISSIAESLGWTEEYTAKVASFAEQKVISLETPIGPDAKGKIFDIIPDSVPTPEDVVMKTNAVDTVHEVLEKIQDDRLRDIIERRFGFSGTEETLQKIGEDYDLTRERIRQLENKAIRLLRHPGKSKVLREI